MITFTVPGPPVPCARARVYPGADGKTSAVTPAKTRAYKTHVGILALAARSDAASWPLAKLYAVTLHVYRAEARGDWDNYAKGLCDALTGILWLDDSQVIEAHVVLHVDRVNPRAEVMVAARGADERHAAQGAACPDHPSSKIEDYTTGRRCSTCLRHV
jgi:Holliday junction resolvase RusA-like endonuclease